MFAKRSAPPPPQPQVRPAPTPVVPVTVPAFRYVYSLEKQRWVEIQTNVCVPNPARGFEAGGMRICFEIEEVDEKGERTANVAKFFKKNIDRVVEVDYFNEGAAQCMSEEFAQNFNRRQAIVTARCEENPLRCVGGTCQISFLMCHVVRIRQKDLPANLAANPALYGRESFFTFRTTDTNEVMFVMEPKMIGTFTKYNSNFGEVYEQSDSKKPLTAQEKDKRTRVFKFSEAFSHFSLEESGGSMLVCDLQGVNDLFTDPQIHTEDGKGLGMGNMGEEGITKWKSKHVCNEVCRALQLRDPNAPIALASPSTSHYQAIRQQSGLFQQRPHDLLAFLEGHQQGASDAAAASTASSPLANTSQNHDGGAGTGSPNTATTKPLSEMTEDELMELAIQRSLAETRHTPHAVQQQAASPLRPL